MRGGISAATMPLKIVGNKVLPYLRSAANSTQASKVYDTIEKVNKNIEERTDVLSYGGVRSKASRESTRHAPTNTPKTAPKRQSLKSNESETRLVLRKQSFSEKCIHRIKNAFPINACKPC